MFYSTLTSKGQTTVPKEVREFLHLSPEDRIIYAIDPQRKQVVLIPSRGSILGLRGSVPQSGGPIDFKQLREKTKKAMKRKPPYKEAA